jgi:hypothetical protein
MQRAEELFRPVIHHHAAYWRIYLRQNPTNARTAKPSACSRSDATISFIRLTEPLDAEAVVQSAQFSQMGSGGGRLFEPRCRVLGCDTGQPLTDPLRHEGDALRSRSI